MNKCRKKKYLKLRQVRRERDYQSGTLQFANRPYSFPTARRYLANGVMVKKYVTTKAFIKSNKIET